MSRMLLFFRKSQSITCEEVLTMGLIGFFWRIFFLLDELLK